LRRCFLLSLFFCASWRVLCRFATAPALLFVAVLMMSSLAQIDWDL
jgi:AGZA family xanthine/uracil permease-like MFS transporter